MKRLPAIILLLTLPMQSLGWNNGQSGNTTTDEPSECTSPPPYSTHDWVADHALALLPDEEMSWLEPHKTLYLLGTESPDNDEIPDACNAPNNGYDDRTKGHSVEWNANWTEMTNERAAVRAREEYDKAVAAFENGDRGAAAYYLGAMAHYLGDLCQYGHAVPFETKAHHSGYENWVSSRTASFDGGHFEQYIVLDQLVKRAPYTAGKRISLATARGKGKIRSAWWMEQHYDDKDAIYLDSVGHSLNLGANELADVLHTFYLNVVKEQ